MNKKVISFPKHTRIQSLFFQSAPNLSNIPLANLFDRSNSSWLFYTITHVFQNTVKLGNKERFDKEQIGIKELIMDYQPFYTINLLLDKELLPI